jgi:histidyl-tRNA synthetase
MTDTGTADSFVLDPSITRGLDYYTGIVYETFLKEDPAIGSVCSGGRYDNLAGLYSKAAGQASGQVSGVGSSIGLDRLVAALEQLGKLKERPSYTALAVAVRGEEDAGRCQALAAQFRSAGIPCEVLLEASAAGSNTTAGKPSAIDGKALTRQFIQAEKKGARWVIIPGGVPETGGRTPAGLTLRDLSSRQNREGLSVRDIIKIVAET